MVDAPQARTNSRTESEPLSAAIGQAARRARWKTLIACIAAGTIGAPLAWLVPGHRILLTSVALVVAAFGWRGAAERILADERASKAPDRVLIIGFTAIRWTSILVGTCAAIASATWLVFDLLGASFRL